MQAKHVPANRGEHLPTTRLRMWKNATSTLCRLLRSHPWLRTTRRQGMGIKTAPLQASASYFPIPGGVPKTVSHYPRGGVVFASALVSLLTATESVRGSETHETSFSTSATSGPLSPPRRPLRLRTTVLLRCHGHHSRNVSTCEI